MFTASVCTSSQLSAFSVKDFQYPLLTVTKENMTTSYSKNISVTAATSTGKSLPITKRLRYTDSLTWLLLLERGELLRAFIQLVHFQICLCSF